MSHPLHGTKDEHFAREVLVLFDDVSRYALSLAREASVAERLVEDTFRSAYRDWHRCRDGSECRAWLFRICHEHFRHRCAREERALPVDDAALESLAAGALYRSAQEAKLDGMFERAEVIEAIASAIDDLPLPYREVALMVDVYDQTYDMVAQTLGVPRGTVRSRLLRARRLVQERVIAQARDSGVGSSAGDERTRQPRRESQ